MIFGPDGMLYVSTGEAGQPDLAQDKGSLGGQDPADHPGRQARARQPRSDSPDLDLRAPQRAGPRLRRQGQPVGLGVRPGHLGRAQPDREGQQLRLARGGGQGWRRRDFADPQVQWRTDDASPSGLAFVDGRLWLGALQGRAAVARRRRRQTRPATDKAFFVGKYGRMRTVVAAPDGNLWVTTSNRDGRGDPAAADDRILLVRP